jgi:hypothetical protein
MKHVIVKNVVENWRVAIMASFAGIVVKIGLTFGQKLLVLLVLWGLLFVWGVKFSYQL